MMTEIFTLDYKSMFASRYKLHVDGIKQGGGGLESDPWINQIHILLHNTK